MDVHHDADTVGLESQAKQHRTKSHAAIPAGNAIVCDVGDAHTSLQNVLSTTYGYQSANTRSYVIRTSHLDQANNVVSVPAHHQRYAPNQYELPYHHSHQFVVPHAHHVELSQFHHAHVSPAPHHPHLHPDQTLQFHQLNLVLPVPAAACHHVHVHHANHHLATTVVVSNVLSHQAELDALVQTTTEYHVVGVTDTVDFEYAHHQPHPFVADHHQAHRASTIAEVTHAGQVHVQLAVNISTCFVVTDMP